VTGLLGSSADWYLMRASGFVALVLLTLTVGLGVANLARLARGRWTRAVGALVHRNASLLAVVFLAIHVLTAISDRYVHVSPLAIVVPGASSYDPLWVGLGAVAVDLAVAVIVTSLVRSRLPQRTWQLVHWLAYLMWPVALVHSIGSGSGSGADTGTTWSTVIYVVCGLAFAGAVAVRLLRRGGPPVPPTGGRGIPSRYAPARTAAAAPARPARSPGGLRRPVPVRTATPSPRSFQ
jgi:predicted ferric reductase